MPYTPTPEQELQNSSWVQTTPLLQASSPFLGISATPSATTTSVSDGSNFIKSRALIIADGPAHTPVTGHLNPSFRIEGVEFDADTIQLFTPQDGTSRLNILIAKIPSAKALYGPPEGTPTAAASLTVSNPFVDVTSSAGPAVAAAFGKTLARTRLVTTANAAGDYIPSPRVVFDLTQNVVATTAANSVITTDEDFRLYAGDRLVAILIPTNGTSTESGTTATVLNGRFRVRLSKVR